MIHALRTFLRVSVIAAICASAPACDGSPSGGRSAPLTDAEIEQMPPLPLDVLIAAYDAVRAAHPTLDDHGNEFARLVFEEAKKRTAAGQKISARTTTFQGLFERLTAEEKSLLMRNLWYLKGTGVSAHTAENRAAADFPGTLNGGAGDAFRHAFWSALLSRCCGTAWAKEFTTAHEGRNVDVNDRAMEFNNNEVGRQIFSANNSASEDQLATLIKKYPIACMKTDVKHAPERLVYMRNCPVIRWFDDGPDFDDIFEAFLDGVSIGSSPKGADKEYETSDLRSGNHSLAITCRLDGTRGGCGFELALRNGIRLSNGSTTTPQLSMAQGETNTYIVVAPTLETF